MTTTQQHITPQVFADDDAPPAAAWRGGKSRRLPPRKERVLVARKRHELLERESERALQEFFDEDAPWGAVHRAAGGHGAVGTPSF